MPERKEKKFEQQATIIKKYLGGETRYNLRRPFHIEFTGSPSAGKTTTITELDKFFRRQGFRVLRPQEGAEVIRHIERTTPIYNVRTGIYALNLLLDSGHTNSYDIIIFDRCIFDAYVWMEYWFEKNKISEEEKNILQHFFFAF